eukprot:TRINITY_DN9824_c0_g1_i2.p1 TRINITY_DN9824_c0_g1~~TRINITY_DN9824_c0_g1_i2.p1  ORF type:complete len:153 (-),score=1.68 TRINITY_DN9824_c0_g1_i2:141-599(-)
MALSSLNINARPAARTIISLVHIRGAKRPAEDSNAKKAFEEVQKLVAPAAARPLQPLTHEVRYTTLRLGCHLPTNILILLVAHMELADVGDRRTRLHRQGSLSPCSAATKPSFEESQRILSICSPRLCNSRKSWSRGAATAGNEAANRTISS